MNLDPKPAAPSSVKTLLEIFFMARHNPITQRLSLAPLPVDYVLPSDATHRVLVTMPLSPPPNFLTPETYMGMSMVPKDNCPKIKGTGLLLRKARAGRSHSGWAWPGEFRLEWRPCRKDAAGRVTNVYFSVPAWGAKL